MALPRSSRSARPARAPASAPGATRVPLPVSGPLVEQPRGPDLLSGVPGLRRLLRWRYARALFQVPLLLLAVLVIWDGLTGRQIASRNLATTASWLHYRGLVVIALAVVGNAFCAACPLMLTRGPSKLVKRALPGELRWPRALKNKWLVLGLLVAFFFSYEAFDLWASPWLTAWIAIGYFVAALAVDSLFPAGTFCRYVCPLGNFNFALASAASPTQITTVDPDVCRACEHKPCLHGRESWSDPARAGGSAAFIPLDEIRHANGEGVFPGCETGLFVPTMRSNMDCTSCFNCVRACPFDNVALTLRSPAWEPSRAPWARRGRLPLVTLGVLLAFFGLLNAVAMIPPFFDLAEAVSRTLGTRDETVLLLTLFALTTLVGLGVPALVGTLADAAGGARPRGVEGVRTAFERWGYVTLVLAFGFWASHYLFHFLTGALSIVPVGQHFLSWRGFDVDPDWSLARIVPLRSLFGITAGATIVYGALAAWVAVRIALRDFGRRRGVLAMWPVLLYVLAFVAVALAVLAQPMEMRGTILGPSF